MAEYKVEIGKRLDAAFGLIGSGIYVPYNNPVKAYDPDYSKKMEIVRPGNEDQGFGKGYFGHANFDELVLSSEATGKVYTFPYEPLIDFSHEHNESTTTITGGLEITEADGNKPIDIQIRGIFWNPNGDYPADQLKEFLAMFKPLTVWNVEKSRLMPLHGISTIKVMSAGMRAVEGYMDTQPFQMRAREFRSTVLTLNQSDLL